MAHYFWLGASADAETGSCPAGQAPAGLDASRIDPARCDNCGGPALMGGPPPLFCSLGCYIEYLGVAA